MFVGCGTRYVRILGDHYYMVSFESEKWARRAIIEAASVPSADMLAGDDWVPTKNGLFVRYVMADDLKQPLFNLPSEKFADADAHPAASAHAPPVSKKRRLEGPGAPLAPSGVAAEATSMPPGEVADAEVGDEAVSRPAGMAVSSGGADKKKLEKGSKRKSSKKDKLVRSAGHVVSR